MFRLKDKTRSVTFDAICREAESVHPYNTGDRAFVTINKGVVYTWHSLVGALCHEPERLFVWDVGNEFYEVEWREADEATLKTLEDSAADWYDEINKLYPSGAQKTRIAELEKRGFERINGPRREI